MQRGVPDNLAKQICASVLSLVATGIVIHGLSVTPIMNRYEARKTARLSPLV